MGAILYALEVPPFGGDTLFANQHLAWETLSDGMKAMLANLKVVHSGIKVAGPHNNLNARRFDGMADHESKPLLDFPMEHGHRPEFTCRFRWQSGSIAFWDNRCTKHLAVHDAGPFRRRMQRTQIAGDAVV